MYILFIFLYILLLILPHIPCTIVYANLCTKEYQRNMQTIYVNKYYYEFAQWYRSFPRNRNMQVEIRSHILTPCRSSKLPGQFDLARATPAQERRQILATAYNLMKYILRRRGVVSNARFNPRTNVSNVYIVSRPVKQR